MPDKVFNVGLLGLGTVGTGVAKILLGNSGNLARRAGVPVVLRKAADLDITRDRGIMFPAGVLTTDSFAMVADPEIDVVVEVIGGAGIARKLIQAALENGKHVVTSNKEVIAKHGQEFMELARKNGVNIYYEASAGGGIPIIHALKNSLAANNIQKIFGILNGTTNYILTKMHREGASFEAVLKEAQALGYAEANPANDVDGTDVAYKLSILASIAFNSQFSYEAIHTEGIRSISADDIKAAKDLGYVIKLIATGIEHGNGQVELRVHPVMIEEAHPLAHVNEVFNAVFVKGNYVDDTMFYGRGAGELPTASAIIGDVLDLAMARELKHSHPSMTTNFEKKSVLPMGETTSEYYLRLEVKDEVGVLAAIAAICRDAQVSIKTVDQNPDKDQAEIVIITHTVKESAMQQALAAIRKLDTVAKVCALIRVGL
ncbi:MAG: homoserine dehydrogenase [Verrucomicrobiota bacterium]|nr:homoserine dehydrogenase [Verrucomicrobiota bacterium]